MSCECSWQEACCILFCCPCYCCNVHCLEESDPQNRAVTTLPVRRRPEPDIFIVEYEREQQTVVNGARTVQHEHTVTAVYHQGNMAVVGIEQISLR
ncbi:hypothetical protein AOXY_G4716 [Acipenser oxyrinchus oxyrinchus]|uniref:Uncharacterized protein n=1 Tax=Acipenser oxyrinchus oxyrinchus TaxID=40147 RepID=A0AAD8GD43_ACIOX|nr:hypothetical protein AOXY_G4716 [Acipenser oxyrinchus oxyrinchus]